MRDGLSGDTGVKSVQYSFSPPQPKIASYAPEYPQDAPLNTEDYAPLFLRSVWRYFTVTKIVIPALFELQDMFIITKPCLGISLVPF